ncbi:MAG TPA: DUF6289 family protein [Thermoanaerobaculia bacterium]
MSFATRLSSLRKPLLAALLLAVLALTFLASAPRSAYAFQGLCTYYSDASHSQVVGQRGTDCCGNPVNWGSTSNYAYCAQEYCIWCPPPAE